LDIAGHLQACPAPLRVSEFSDGRKFSPGISAMPLQ
jgi:hypothetical protein